MRSMPPKIVAFCAVAGLAAILVWSIAAPVVAQDMGGGQPAAGQGRPATQPAGAGGATGTWTWEVDTPGGAMEVVLTLQQQGNTLTGTVTGFGGEAMPIDEGKVEGDKVTVVVVRDWGGQTVTTTYTGTISGDTLTGESTTVFSRAFEAQRAKE